MTNEQIAALRAARQRMKSAVKIYNWEDALEAFWEICTPVTIDSLLDHIAKLEADSKRYQWLRDEGYLNAWWSVQDNDRNIGISKTIDESIEITSRFSIADDDQRHEAVAKILKDTP